MNGQGNNKFRKEEEKMSAQRKDEYTLEEAAELMKNGLATSTNYQRGKENLIIHANTLLYERRKPKDSICPHCHERITYEEKWYLLGDSVEAKKEGGLEQDIKKTSEEGGNPRS